MSAPRAVVTGIGVAAPNGLGTAAWWANTRAGVSAIATLTRFDPRSYGSVLAGEINDFEAAEHIPSRLLPQTDHMTRLALFAADEALTDSGAGPEHRPEYGAGVVTASSAGGFEFGQRELQALWGKGGEYVSAYQSFAWFYAVNSGQISIRHDMRGPSGVLVSDGAGGLDAVGQARRHVRKGVPLLVTGSVDSALCPWGWVSLTASGRLTGQADPDRAYLPFDADASGHVAGEGGAILVVEAEQAALARGARVYGVIAGYAATFDPHPDSGRPPALGRAIELALADARVSASDVDVVFADAAGSPDLDRQEADAITEVFGRHGVPVTAPKTMTGRLYSGAAALDLAAALLSIRDGVVPPTVNVRQPADGTFLDLVTEARTGPVRTALVLARGHGGFNAAVVVTAHG